MNSFLEEYPPILSVSDVAKILAVSPDTIRKLIRNNCLHAIKIGKRYKITKNQLLNYLGEGEMSQVNTQRKEMAV